MEEYSRIDKIPNIVDEIYLKYSSIPVPYYNTKNINFSERILRKLKSSAYKGKGSIDSIKAILNDLKTRESEKLSDNEILYKHGIGIDCSGFISHLLDSYTRSKFSKHIWEFYTRKTLNPYFLIRMKINPIQAMLNANTLTSNENTISIKQVKDAKPLDLIRMSGGKHLAMIYKMYYKDNLLKMIEYIHSTEGVGVCNGFIKIKNENETVFKQDWLKSDWLKNKDDESRARYEPSYLIKFKINLNGIRRPKFLIEK